MKFNKHIVHNYSTYSLSNEQYIALSYGLDTHIPSRTNANMIYNEFEVFFQGLLKDTGNIPETELQLIKTKLRNTCEKYTKIKVPYKYRKIINELRKREEIAVLKADKGRGIVIMNKDKYHEKCLQLLETEQFQKLSHDPTKTTERKVQNASRKIKSRLSINEYKGIYPTGSSPGKLYGTAKIHKLSDRDGIKKLSIHPVIYNLNTATYHLAKYLAKLLSPLSTSEYTVSSSKEFMTTIKNVQVPSGYHMVSFDVKSLFTNVPLKYTIGLVLEQIYNKGELVTNITRSEMKEMLLLCTKNVHFSYNHDIYIQRDGVAMGSPLGPVLAGIFMMNLERSLVPKLNVYINLWRRHVDDTITFVKIGSVEYLLSVLNNFHPKIKFTYKMEVESKLAFLDILLHRDGLDIITTVYRKVTNSDVNLNWYSFCPREWKR